MLQGWMVCRTLFKSRGSYLCLWADGHGFLYRDFFSALLCTECALF